MSWSQSTAYGFDPVGGVLWACAAALALCVFAVYYIQGRVDNRCVRCIRIWIIVRLLERCWHAYPNLPSLPCRGNDAAVAHGMLRLAAARGDLTTLELLSSLPGFDPDARLDGFTAVLAAVVHDQRGTQAQLLNSTCNGSNTSGFAMVQPCSFASATFCCWMPEASQPEIRHASQTASAASAAGAAIPTHVRRGHMRLPPGNQYPVLHTLHLHLCTVP
jgi:hypothetical protein